MSQEKDRNTGTQFLDVNGVAKMFNLRPKSVYAMAERGVLPSFKVGSALRFDRDELLQHVKGGER